MASRTLTRNFWLGIVGSFLCVEPSGCVLQTELSADESSAFTSGCSHELVETSFVNVPEQGQIVRYRFRYTLQNQTSSYDVLSKKSIDRNSSAPYLVFAFHGMGSSPEIFAESALWPREVLARNMVVILPEMDDHFTVGLDETTAEKSRTPFYSREILAALPTIKQTVMRFLVLPNDTKVGATGFSLGAGIAVEAACEAQSIIDVVAPVSGSVFANANCLRQGPFPIFLIFDPEDKVMTSLNTTIQPEFYPLTWQARNACEEATPWLAEQYPPGLDVYDTLANAEEKAKRTVAEIRPQCMTYTCGAELSVCRVDTPRQGTSSYSLDNFATRRSHYWSQKENGFDTTHAVLSFFERTLF